MNGRTILQKRNSPTIYLNRRDSKFSLTSPTILRNHNNEIGKQHKSYSYLAEMKQKDKHRVHKLKTFITIVKQRHRQIFKKK